ncbi:MAG: pilus assembly protein CpaE [Ornithinimicrobium sp.]
MITLELAHDLHSAGLLWSPLAGDRFAVDKPGMEDEVFYLADMTVDVQRFVGGSVIGFNGVAEWALDSVDLEETLWLPREDQMRAVLGESFVRLERDDDGRYAVHLAPVPEAGQEAVSVAQPHQDAECAYAHAVLAVLQR